jgi:serine/threonine protein kinase
MDNTEKINNKILEPDRLRRLATDVTVTPVEELPEGLLKEIYPDGAIPKGYFAIERKNARSLPRIVNRDVVDVLTAFGEKGASYRAVLDHFTNARNLDREELDSKLKGLVLSLIRNSLLVDAGDQDISSAESIRPSLRDGDRWLDYTVLNNVHCIIDSEIYKVAHAGSGEVRALKIMQNKFPNKEMRERIITRLTREFSVLRSIRHPHVVNLREQGVHQGRTYGILDWIDGPPVTTYAHESQFVPSDRLLLQLAIQCGEALAAVHQVGYLHGDVHTGNFLIKEGRVCLIDFGLARPVEISEQEQSKYDEGGVILYMPPEYARKEFNKEKGLWGSIAGEIYSCAVIMFLLMTKRVPYTWRYYREDYMRSILEEPPLYFKDCGRTSWPELEDILRKAMAKNPKDRFESMKMLLRALKSVRLPAHADRYPFDDDNVRKNGDNIEP